MEVILIQDVANLGYKNDIVKVRDGYGRNYLLPNKMAIIANESNRKQLAENLKQQAHKLAKLLADAQALAEKLAAVVINVLDAGFLETAVLFLLLIRLFRGQVADFVILCHD